MINYSGFLPWIILKTTAINAITNSMCIMEPALYAKKPIAQNITNITAMV